MFKHKNSSKRLAFNIIVYRMNWVNTSLIGVFVVSACPDRLFETLKKAPVAKYIQTLLEINVSFIAYESQVMKVFVSVVVFGGLGTNMWLSFYFYTRPTHTLAKI